MLLLSYIFLFIDMVPGTIGLGSNGKQVVEICLYQHKPVVSSLLKTRGTESALLVVAQMIGFIVHKWFEILTCRIFFFFYQTPTELAEVGVIVITTMLYTSIKSCWLLGCIIHSKRVSVCCVMKQGIIYRAVEEKLGPSQNAARGAHWNQITFFGGGFRLAFISRIALMGMSEKEREHLPRLHKRHHDGAM